MKINKELKENIITDIKNELNYKEICDKYKISKNSVYKIKKELE
jgi:Mor family transcriptional regulator